MKTVIREIIAMIILVAAIILVTITFFFDYIKDQANQPQSAVYKMSDEESTILKERQNYINSQNKIVLSSAYSIDSSDVQNYKATNQLKTGQSNPFDEAPITDVIYDADGKEIQYDKDRKHYSTPTYEENKKKLLRNTYRNNLYGADRSNLISMVHNLGLNWNVERFTTQQLYRMLEKELNKK